MQPAGRHACGCQRSLWGAGPLTQRAACRELLLAERCSLGAVSHLRQRLQTECLRIRQEATMAQGGQGKAGCLAAVNGRGPPHCSRLLLQAKPHAVLAWGCEASRMLLARW